MGRHAPSPAAPAGVRQPVAGDGAGAPGALTTAFWGAVAGAAPATNRLVVDLHELAFAAWVRVPPVGAVRLRHRFPHARSVAWSVYNPFTLSPVEALRDREIVPRPGSANPFLPGADRTAPDRDYEISVVRGAEAEAEAGGPNVLSSRGLPLVLLFYRLYVPDRGRDRLGDAGLPVPDEGPRRASLRRRAAAGIASAIVWNSTAVGLTPAYLALRVLGRDPVHPATAAGRWDAFFNLPRLAEPLLRGTPAARATDMLPRSARGPASNWATDSAIAMAYVDRRLGPDPEGRNVLILRGRMPETPRTWRGDAVMEADVDLRYWSLSSMSSIPIGVTTASLFDEQVPVDDAGRYTVVVSTAADRPANATLDRGVAWLEWPSRGDGLGRPDAGMLVLRNQDPSPGFHRAIQDVPAPGGEAATMGSYLPGLQYMSRAQFEEEGPR